MAKWRALEDYSPFARMLVEYMWEQRPPLLPNQFAVRLGVRKQQVSTWLNTTAVPAPPVLVRLARNMGKPVRELFLAADYATAADPLLDRADAWNEVLQVVTQAPETQRLAPEQQETLLALLHTLQAQMQAQAQANPPTYAQQPQDTQDTQDTPAAESAERNAEEEGRGRGGGEEARDSSGMDPVLSDPGANRMPT